MEGTLKNEEVSARQAAVMLNIRLDVLYPLIWAKQLAARKSQEGRWLVSVAAVQERLRRREKARAESAA